MAVARDARQEMLQGAALLLPHEAQRLGIVDETAVAYLGLQLRFARQRVGKLQHGTRLLGRRDFLRRVRYSVVQREAVQLVDRGG